MCFQISIDNLEDIIFWFHYHLRLSRTEVLSWEYYVFETQLEKLINALKKKKEAEESANKQSTQKMPSMPSMPKMPSMPSMPKF